ncbi:hypothetical protein AGOR_G00068130 [Albula goreensis]|uniref:PDZ domain-containing protein n=1 Tax=Albula goreensis TaxID=1534307 RepID=A0A8T3DLZ1_9TELE|nr:hypothetical protein AGOR_G00068130 [Albula goreensis]
MSAKDTPVKGGVSILHQQVEGKHQYEVDHVVKYKKGWLSSGFVRKGDKLLKINGQNLEDVTPEVFAELLTTASPMLTVHQAAAKEKKKKCADRGGLYPFNKEKTCMRFSLEMMQEQQLDENGGGHHRGNSGGGDKGRPDCSGGLDDLLLISMRRASISIVKGRGCNPGSPCHDCVGAGCNFNDVVMVAESSQVTLVRTTPTHKCSHRFSPQ